MLRTITFVSSLVLGLMGLNAVAQADDGNWKLGRVYYRMVCTECHQQKSGAISPSGRTKAEWAAYLDADVHDASKKSEPKVSFYVSRPYRESVKDKNKAAEKFLDMPQDKLMADVRAFVIHGAKDSDTPESCQ